MEEIGTVVVSSGDTVKVELETSDKCGHCGAKVFCHPGSGSKMYIEAINRIGAKLGNKVKIEVAPSISALAGFLLFVLPIVAVLIVYAVARIFTKNENFAVIAGFGGLILSFLFLVRINRKVAKNKRFHPAIKEIVSR